MSEFMTTKEVAQVFGVSVHAVNEYIKKHFPEIVKHGVQTRLNQEQVTEISRHFKRVEGLGRPKGTSSELGYIYPSASKSDNTPSEMTLSASKSDNEVARPLTELEILQDADRAMHNLSGLIQRLKADNHKLQEANKQLCIQQNIDLDYASVKQMELLNKVSFSWKPLKDFSQENEIPIIKVFDQNYVSVNAYRRDVWMAIYGEQLDNLPLGWTKENY